MFIDHVCWVINGERAFTYAEAVPKSKNTPAFRKVHRHWQCNVLKADVINILIFTMDKSML